jgi:hypothetical protein
MEIIREAFVSLFTVVIRFEKLFDDLLIYLNTKWLPVCRTDLLNPAKVLKPPSAKQGAGALMAGIELKWCQSLVTSPSSPTAQACLLIFRKWKRNHSLYCNQNNVGKGK